MLPLPAHALPDDVDEGEDADLGVVDDLELEDREIAPAGRARIDDGGDAGGEGIDDRVERELRAGVGLEAVDMHVDDARHDVVARHVQDGFSGGRR